MTVVVRTITRILLPISLVFGGYVVMHGHLTPGGGFQGGAVAASGLALVIVAFSAGRLAGKKGLFSALGSLGAVAFAALGFLGLGGATFFANVLAGSGKGELNTVFLMDWAVGFKVLAGLSAVVLLFALFGGESDR